MPEQSICGLLVPHPERLLRDLSRKRRRKPACILPSGHKGSVHVFRNSMRVLIAWEYDDECRCGCLPDDPERCYKHRFITEAEFMKLLSEAQGERL